MTFFVSHSGKASKVAIILILLSLGLIANPSPAKAWYYCGTSDARCYGINEWPGLQHGGYTNLSIVQMSSTNIINNTIWNIRTSGRFAWIEVGEIFIGGELWYYWEYELDPNPRIGVRLLTRVPPGDIGQIAFMGTILNTPNWSFSSCGISTWIAGISVPSSGYDVNICVPLYGFSPDYLTIGQELQGSSDTPTNAPIASFTRNKYADLGSNQLYDQFGIAPGEPRSISVPQGSPPYGYWYTLPQPFQTSGDFRTYCCA